MSKHPRTSSKKLSDGTVRGQSKRATNVPAYARRRGRLRAISVVAQADAAAGQALVKLARVGAGVVLYRDMSEYKLQGCLRRCQAPRRVSDARLAELLELGSGPRGIAELAKGTRPISRRSSAKAVEQIVKCGLLARRAVSPLAVDSGHARLMAPFEPLIDALRAMAPCAYPEAALERRLKRYVILYRAAVRDLNDFENAERSRFLDARAAVINALAELRFHESPISEAELRTISVNAASWISKLLSSLEALKSLKFSVKPLPRMLAARWANGLLPPAGADSEPDFGSLFAWLEAAADPYDSDLQTAVAIQRALVGGTWAAAVDRPHQGGRDSGGTWKLVGLYPTSEAKRVADFVDRKPCELPPARWDDGEPVKGAAIGCPPSVPSDSGLYVWLTEHLPPVELKFIRRLRRSIGDFGVKKLLAFQIAERWYGEDEEHDSVESDFENRLLAVCLWVQSRFAWSKKLAYQKRLEELGIPTVGSPSGNRPTLPDLKALIRDVCRTELRRETEWNADIPQATRRRHQFWFPKPKTQKRGRRPGGAGSAA